MTTRVADGIYRIESPLGSRVVAQWVIDGGDAVIGVNPASDNLSAIITLLRMLDDFPPVGGFQHRAAAGGQLLCGDRAAAHGRDPQPKAQLVRDLVPVFGKNGQGSGANVAQAHDADSNFLHISR